MVVSAFQPISLKCVYVFSSICLCLVATVFIIIKMNYYNYSVSPILRQIINSSCKGSEVVL
jgi:hypothetical protein